jgi:HTH-type transcriptional regulator/antitoxin HigA
MEPRMTSPLRDVRPGHAPHAPGDLLREELEAGRLTQAELALRTGMSTKHVNQLMTGTATVSPKVAWILERALGVDADLVLALDARYQAHKVRLTSMADLESLVPWALKFPLRELRRLGHLRDEHGVGLVAQLLGFFGVSNKDSFDNIYGAVVGFRRSQHNTVDELATATWLRLAELQVRRHPLADFDIHRVRKTIPRLLEFTNYDDDECFLLARQELTSCGVALAFVPDLSGSRACGATKWLPTGHPLVVITDRFKKSDSTWYSLFHELGHVALHPKRITIVSLGDDGDDADGYEAEANEFAARLIVPTALVPELETAGSLDDIAAIAEQVPAHFSLVAGQWAHLHDGYRTVAKYRPSLDVAALVAAAAMPM